MPKLTRTTMRAAMAADLRELDRIEQWSWARSTHPGAGNGFAPFASRFELAGTFIAQVREEVVGYASTSRASGDPAQSHVWRLHSIVLRPEHRHQGLGRELMTCAEGFAACRGARKMKLRVLSSNVNAIRFYEACGYAIEARLVDEYRIDGSYVDELTMARRIECRG